MKVFVVDPSLFTRTYDQGLARGLAGAGADVTLIGRPLRRAESLDTRGYRFLPMFYRLAETGEDELGRARLALKGAEHVLGLARLRALVARERPDIVHVQWLTLPFLDGRLWRSLARRMPVGTPSIGTSSATGSSASVFTSSPALLHTSIVRAKLLAGTT